MREEIHDTKDVRLLVDRFYERVSADDLLAPIFYGRITDMPSHLQRMYRFWETILLEESSYDSLALSKHADLPLMNQHFTRWLTLFLDTIDELYSGPSAELAKLRAIRMAEEFQVKLELPRF
jgi:hemoglobin